MRIFIVTEGGNSAGIGHITRCSSLYQAFEGKGIIPEFVINGDETVKSLLKDKKYTIFDWLQEKERLYSLIKGADILFIDSYLAGLDFYNEVSGLVKTCVYIDDNNRFDYPNGIVLNGSINAEDLSYSRKAGIVYLLGPAYMPLRREFQGIADKAARESISTVMVTFGGDDSRNMTPKVLRMLAESHPEFVKKVVIGHGFKNIEEIDGFKDKNTELILYPDAEEMKKVMLESDVAISAGGQTLYELARVGVPTLAIAVAENQMNNIRGWDKAGFIKYAAWWEDDGTLENISAGMNLLKDRHVRDHMCKAGRTLVDGKGAERTIKKVMRHHIETSLVLRKARMDDAYTLFELSNDLEVRGNSFNPEKIEFEDHKKWLAGKLQDKNVLFLIAEENNNLVGQVRFEMSEDEAVISISIAKSYRGLGIGCSIINEALSRLRLESPFIKVVKAYVKEQNTSSLNFFEKAGFKFMKKVIIKNQDAFEYHLINNGN